MFKILVRDGSLESSENFKEKVSVTDLSYIGNLIINNEVKYLYYSSFEGTIFALSLYEKEKNFSYLNSSFPEFTFNKPTATDSTILLDDSYCNLETLQHKLEQVRLFIKYCSEHNNLKILRFRSKNEPTKYIHIIKNVVELSKNDFKIDEFAIQSNFLFNSSVRKFLFENFSIFHVSINGNFPLHKKHKSLNTNQYCLIEDNLKFFCQKTGDLVVHCNVSKFSINYLVDIVDYFFSLGIKVIFFEPINDSQSINNKDEYNTTPDIHEFLEKLLSAKLHGLSKGIVIESTLLPVDGNHGKLHYCGGVSCSMSLSPDGLVSSCDEHTFYKKENLFIIGKTNFVSGKIDFYEKKLQYLKKRTPLNMLSCKNCLLKFSCLGQCPYRTLCSTGNIFKANCKSCAFIKEYSKKYLFKLTKEILQKNKGV